MVVDAAASTGRVVPAPLQALAEGKATDDLDVVKPQCSPRVLREGRLKAMVCTP